MTAQNEVYRHVTFKDPDAGTNKSNIALRFWTISHPDHPEVVVVKLPHTSTDSYELDLASREAAITLVLEVLGSVAPMDASLLWLHQSQVSTTVTHPEEWPLQSFLDAQAAADEDAGPLRIKKEESRTFATWFGVRGVTPQALRAALGPGVQSQPETPTPKDSSGFQAVHVLEGFQVRAEATEGGEPVMTVVDMVVGLLKRFQNVMLEGVPVSVQVIP